MSETSEEKERRVVAKCMRHLPITMNKDDGEVLLTLLYKIGDLTDHLDAVAEAEGKSRGIRFSTYFDFEKDVELDSEGRITFLFIHSPSTYDVPPIIERLQKLQRIRLPNCKLIPIELGNLPLLESITFALCGRDLFENIPDGLLLSALKQVEISDLKPWGIIHGSCPTLSAFWKMLPDTLEELHFVSAKDDEPVDQILHALQYNDFGFRDSLTYIAMANCQLNQEDLERLLFDILPRFPNIHTLNLGPNAIKSLRGIGDRIKQLDRISASSSSPPSQTVIPDNKLRKLFLKYNPVASKLTNNPRAKVSRDPKEVAALITILDAFDGIYYIGHNSSEYASDVEHLLRINHAGRKFIREGEKEFAGSNKPVIKLALWPKILEKAHTKSAEIYGNDGHGEETKNRRKCATGLFHLVRHFCGPLLAENYHFQSYDNRETSSAAAALSTAEDRDGVENKDALNHKRKHS